MSDAYMDQNIRRACDRTMGPCRRDIDRATFRDNELILTMECPRINRTIHVSTVTGGTSNRNDAGFSRLEAVVTLAYRNMQGF